MLFFFLILYDFSAIALCVHLYVKIPLHLTYKYTQPYKYKRRWQGQGIKPRLIYHYEKQMNKNKCTIGLMGKKVHVSGSLDNSPH